MWRGLVGLMVAVGLLCGMWGCDEDSVRSAGRSTRRAVEETKRAAKNFWEGFREGGK